MSELKPCPFCGGEAELCYGDRWNGRDYFAFVRCTNCNISPFHASEKKTRSIATEVAISAWNTRPADAVRVKGEKFLHAVEAYHDAIKLRDDVENSHMWSCELRAMYDAMVGFRAALAQDGKEHP